MTDIDIAATGAAEANPIEASSAVETQTDPQPEMHQVNIQGQTVEVTQEELINGYMRQSDYTRKTTEAANLKAEAEQGILLMDALNRDPQEAVMAMVEHYKLNGVAQRAANNDGYDYEEEASPVNSEIEELRQEIRNIKQESARSLVDKESQKLIDDYGATAEDVEAAKRHAVLNGYPSIESAFQNLHFSNAFEAQKRETERKATDDRILEEKRQAAAVVGTQGSNPARGNEPAPRQENLSIRDAIMESLKEQNLEPKDLINL